MEEDETQNPFLSNQKLKREYKLKTPDDRFISTQRDTKRFNQLFRDTLRETKPILMTPTSNKRVKFDQTPQRMLSKTPDLILEAPDARNDFYGSLVDWSSLNQILLALDRTVLIWSITDSFELYEADDYLNSVKFSPNGRTVGIGNDQIMLIHDIESEATKQFEHENGVSTIIFKNENEFVCGDALGDLHFWDKRSQHSNSLLGFHRDRVVGMSIKDNLLATGENGNIVNIWDDRRKDKPVFTFKDHTSATRALAFCPFKDILATGGGLDDGTIKLYSTNSGNLIKSIKSGNQVCALTWSLHYKELLCCQAGPDQMKLYQFPSMDAIFQFEGHNQRTIDVAKSPDGQSVVTLGDDECLKFWDMFKVKDGTATLKTPPKDSKNSIR